VIPGGQLPWSGLVGSFIRDPDRLPGAFSGISPNTPLQPGSVIPLRTHHPRARAPSRGVAARMTDAESPGPASALAVPTCHSLDGALPPIRVAPEATAPDISSTVEQGPRAGHSRQAAVYVRPVRERVDSTVSPWTDAVSNSIPLRTCSPAPRFGPGCSVRATVKRTVGRHRCVCEACRWEWRQGPAESAHNHPSPPLSTLEGGNGLQRQATPPTYGVGPPKFTCGSWLGVKATSCSRV